MYYYYCCCYRCYCSHIFTALSPKHTSNVLLLYQRWLCLSQWRSYFLLELKIWFAGGTSVLLVSWLRVWDCQGKEVMGRLMKRKDAVYLCQLCIIWLSALCEMYFTKTLIDFITQFILKERLFLVVVKSVDSGVKLSCFLSWFLHFQLGENWASF